MRVTFCWAEISGYMSACWRALAAEGEIDVSVIAADPGEGMNTSFPPDLLAGLPHAFLSHAALAEPTSAIGLVEETRPDIVVVSGWMFRAYREVVAHHARRGVPVIMAMDNPKRSELRAALRRARSRALFRDVDAVVVPGERGRQLARSLGFRADQVYSGLYGVGHLPLSKAFTLRTGRCWPRRFLFIGQLTETKGVDRLLDAYVAYRRGRPTAWTLTVCGLGPLEDRVRTTEGVHYRGFVQPEAQLSLLAEHGAFVILSRLDPWPLALVEACAAGLPVICTNSCGSSVEVVRDHHNGRVLSGSTVEEATEAMRWMESEPIPYADMGRHSVELASPYSAQRWAQRWTALLTDVARRSV